MDRNSQIPAVIVNAAKTWDTFKNRGDTFPVSTSCVARTLEIKPDEAEAALSYLIGLGYVRRRGENYIFIRQEPRRPDPHLETVANFFPPYAAT